MVQQHLHPLGISIRFNVSDAPSRVNGPWVDAKLIGISPTVGQTIEDRFGKPIRVDTDIHGRNRVKPIAGPFADLRQGKNTVDWSASRENGGRYSSARQRRRGYDAAGVSWLGSKRR